MTPHRDVALGAGAVASAKPEPENGISVVLATYNGGRYIAEQLRSVFAQTLLPLEIIVADDGSSDDTLAQVEALRAESPVPLTSFSNEQRLGYGDNFLNAALRARGKWVAFCDQDDVWYADKLASCAAAFHHPNMTAVMHNVHIMHDRQRSDETLTHAAADEWVPRGRTS
jgi:glycosyltransferase involved in cell wall biosynthesis